MATSKSRVNPDLHKERSTGAFNVEQLTHLLDGGSRKTRRRREIENLMFSIPEFDDRDSIFNSRDESYERGIAKCIKIKQLTRQYRWPVEDMHRAMSCINQDTGLFLHEDVFVPTIKKLGTDEQKDKWLPLAENFEVIGAYAQTELGHGTFLRGLETTATYDESREEFIIQSPTLSARKWWPGGLGKTSNHVVAMAQLITKGRNCGMQAFIVPIRDKKTHLPLPGISVGDIGPKMGSRSNDHGYLVFDHVHVPRDNMLMKYSKVSRDGIFSRSGDDKMTYGTMVQIRAQIIGISFDNLTKALTIAVRYSSVRRQSKMKNSKPECQILDFQTQQYKLFPYLAAVYAIWFASRTLDVQYRDFMEAVQTSGNTNRLPLLHSQSSGLKAWCTDLTLEGIGILLRACGGHGYLQASGLPNLLSNFIPMTIVEGENTVLYLQTARFQVKQYGRAVSGLSVADQSLDYLTQDWTSYSCPLSSKDQLTKSKAAILNMYKKRAFYLIAKVDKRLRSEVEKGQSPETAWNNCLVELIQAAQAHIHYYMVQNCYTGVESVDTTTDIREVLLILCQFFAIYGISKCSGDFLQASCLSPAQLELVKAVERDLLASIRPNAVSLVDAFDIHEMRLNSALGCYDGNVYEKLVESASRNPLNKTEVHPSFYKHIKPLQANL